MADAIARLRKAVRLQGGLYPGGSKPPDWDVLMTEAVLELADREPRAAVASLEAENARLKSQLEQAHRVNEGWFRRLEDPAFLAETLHILGIPARDMATIFRMEQDWRRSGGTDRMLELLAELHELREYKANRERLDASLAASERLGG